MAVSKKWSIYALLLDDTVPVTIQGITRQNLRSGLEVNREATQGEIYSRWHALVAGRAGATLASYEVKDVIDNLGVSGLSIATIANGLKLYAQAHEDGATRKAGSTHRLYTTTAGILFMPRLSVDHQGNVLAEMETVLKFDGSNACWQITDSSALGGTLDSVEDRWTLGPITMGAVTINQVTNLEVDFGVTAVPEGADSDIWPTFVSISEIQPEIRVTGTDIEWMGAANIPLEGKKGTHANTTIYLRKRDFGATFVADETAEHIKLSADGLITIDPAFDGAGAAAASITAVMRPVYDGTNAPIKADTASAIT